MRVSPKYSLWSIGYSFCLIAGLFAQAACGGGQLPVTPEPEPEVFDGGLAYQDVEYQVDLGPRLPESEAHQKVVEWMVAGLEKDGWTVTVQETTRMDQPVRNVIAERGDGRPWVVIGAHYDSRMLADQDPNPENHTEPVPGANDGASGVAVLLELARVLPTYPQEDLFPGKISLVFFDSEDNGHIPGWDWILGSRAYVDSLEEHPDMAVVIDMIGDADQNIYHELNSDPQLSQEIWDIAAELGYGDRFIDQPKYRILDDHLPFVEAGIRAVDLIDFDYPYWHTVQDTPDKVSADSLKAVGDILIAWLQQAEEPTSTQGPAEK